jgi:hypothetical protein
VIRTVLIVSEDLVEADRWAGWLERAGFLTVMCAGPRLRHDCPRLDGASCLLREAVDAAVIAVPPLEGDAPGGSCTRLPDDGSTIRVEGGYIVASTGDGANNVHLTKLGMIDAVTSVRPRAGSDPH